MSHFLKLFGASVLLVSLLASCGGYKPCETYKDCLDGEVCGFIEDISMNQSYCVPASSCSDMPNVQLCTAKVNVCQKENQIKGCIKDNISGCQIDGIAGCQDGTACLPANGTASCAKVCKSSKECSGSLGCRPLPGYSNAHCSDNADYLTVETQCSVTIDSAKIPAGNWDNIVSGAKSKADPYVVIQFASGKKLTTKTFQDSTAPEWKYTTSKVAFSEIAKMYVTLYDSDKGQVIANKDDVIGSWSTKNDRWLLKNTKKKDLGLASGTVRLYLSIQCD